MKHSTTDQIEGTAHVIKGTVKEAVGDVLNDPKRKLEGKAEQVLGHVQKAAGEVEKKLGV